MLPDLVSLFWKTGLLAGAWRLADFAPAAMGGDLGKPAKVQATIEINFRLN
jgi:hypothetical protein